MKYLLLLLLAGCSFPENKYELDYTEEIKNIAIVFFNKEMDYTVFIEKDDELISRNLRGTENVRIFKDIPKDKPMYAKITCYTNKYYPAATADLRHRKIIIELHIRDKYDLQAGSWQKSTGGKQSRTITGKVNRLIP